MATRITTYDPKDIKLIKSRPIFTNFGTGLFDDYVELHVLSGDNVIESSYNVSSWSVNQEDTQNQSPTIKLDIHNDIRNLGYRSGRFNLQYNFFRNIVGSNSNTLIIDEISNSRQEIRLRLLDPENNALAEEFLAFGRRDQNPDLIDIEVDFFRDIRLNFGENNALLAINWLVDYKAYPESPHSLVVKLYEPLPDNIEEKDELWIVKAVIESIIEPILVEYTPPSERPNLLAAADFTLDVSYDTPSPTGWKNLDELVSTQPTVRNKILDRISRRTGSLGEVELNFDFNIEGTDFSNLIHFGSAFERLENFKYKLRQIESYSSSIASLSSNLTGLAGSGASSSVYYQSNVTKFTNLQSDVISTFDEFEQHLYYESASHNHSNYGHFWPLTWPKTSAIEPYTLAKVDSTIAKDWYGSINAGEELYYQRGAIYSASLYDVQNENSLRKLIPSHILENNENFNFQLYIDMIAQHFDYIYHYTKELTQIHDRENPLFEGISKDLVQPVLESFGWYPHQGFDFDELWTYATGTDESGSYGGNTINYTADFSQSVTFANNSQASQSFSKEEITKELWKRILNNLPHVYKTKGTERSVRAITSLYGLPSTILKIYEYGGPQKLPNRHSKIIYDRFNYGLRIESSSGTGGSYLEAPWAVASASRGPARYPDTVEFRFKVPDLSHQGKEANSKLKKNTVLWNTHSGSLAIIAEHTRSMNSSAPTDSPYGRIVFALSGSHGQPSVTASTKYAPIFDGDWWNVAFMRYDANKLSQDYAFTESVSINDHHGQNLTYDLFCKKQGDFSQYGRISHHLSSSFTTDGTTEAGQTSNAAWGKALSGSSDNYPTAETESTLRQYLGGDRESATWLNTLGDSFVSLNETKTFSGSMQEWRVYHNHLTESYFNHHVGAPRTIANSTNETASYSELLARWPLGCDLFRVDFSNGSIVSSSHPDVSNTRFVLLNNLGAIVGPIKTEATFSNFSNTGLAQYEEVEERHYTLSPRNIGPSPYSEKIRLEDNQLKGNLASDAKKEFSSADKNPIDENRLGVYFSPQDEIELDIAHEFGPFLYDDYVGSPSDEYVKRYTPLKQLRESYFQKYTGNPTFFDFLHILKYFDDSLFRTVRQLLPARANSQVGLLIKPHGLERPKVVAKPSASLVGYNFLDRATNKFQQTSVEGEINLRIASASGNTTELGSYYSESYGAKPQVNSSRVGRDGAQMLAGAGHKNTQINKNYHPSTNREKELALINTAVGELEGGMDYIHLYDHRYEGSRYIYTTVDLSNVSATGNNGARIWNSYWQRDGVGTIIHNQPHHNIIINDKIKNLHNGLGQTVAVTNYIDETFLIQNKENLIHPSAEVTALFNGSHVLDNYTASNDLSVSDGHKKWGLNRKYSGEVHMPFIGSSRKSFERKKQIFYYATAFSQSRGLPIPESDITSGKADNYIGSRTSGSGIKVFSGSLLTEPAEFQDYKATAIHNVYYNGCKLVGSDFNMESSQTIDGGPVVEYNEISPYKYVAADDSADGRVLTSGDGSGRSRETIRTSPLRGSGRVAARPSTRTGRFRG